MSALRDEIRAILREELAAVMVEASGLSVKTVRIETSDDLNAFARDLIDQMSNPRFAGKVKSGEVRFVLERAPAHVPVTPAIPAKHHTPPHQVPLLNKSLITEADLSDAKPGLLRVPQHARLTPLAKDEARRKGVRIERTDS